jgi:Family of unknown function (DUF6252)
MKNTIKNLSILFITILFTTTFACCKKSFVPKTPYGSNTISCKINGETFETKGPNGGNNISCNNEVYITGGLNGNTINAKMCDGVYHTLRIVLWQPWKVGTYELGNGQGIGSAQFIKSSPTNYFNCKNSPQTGNITITELTSTFISGTFTFTALGENGELYIVIDGKFDIAR